MKNLKAIDQFNVVNESKSKDLRIERRENKTYAFIEVINGDAKNAKEVDLTNDQRTAIEKILNK